MGFDEFVQLWRHLKNWCEIFKKHDVDGSSTIQASELREAFREVGINVNRQILRMLVNRFGHHKKSSATLEDQLYFDDFICCSLKMKRCIEVWNNKKNKGISLPGAFSIFARSAFDRIGNVGNESSFTLDEVILDSANFEFNFTILYYSLCETYYIHNNLELWPLYFILILIDLRVDFACYFCLHFV